jgi:hypothetical protein
MKTFSDTILTVVVIGGVLIIPLLLTNLFVRKMYYRCAGCGALNAKRRSNCRICSHELG